VNVCPNIYSTAIFYRIQETCLVEKEATKSSTKLTWYLLFAHAGILHKTIIAIIMNN